MKLLSITIPSYNAAAYLHYCVESLVIGGEQVEDFDYQWWVSGPDSGNRWAFSQQEYPNIVRAIYQENKGPWQCGQSARLGGASRRYFKVVDSDDWVDTRAYLKILETLQELEWRSRGGCLCDQFCLWKGGQSRKKGMSYESVLPVQQILAGIRLEISQKASISWCTRWFIGQICCERASSNCLSILLCR